MGFDVEDMCGFCLGAGYERCVECDEEGLVPCGGAAHA